MATIRLSVLGPTAVSVGGVAVDLPPRQRTLLAALALHSPRSVESDRLVDLVWGVEPPKSARASLHNAVGRLRTALGDDVVITEGQAYRLGGDVVVDATECVGALTTLSVASPPEAFGALAEQWSADAYIALPDTPDVTSARSALAANRGALSELWAGSLLGHDRPAEAIALLRPLTSNGTRSASAVALLAIALYRTGDPVEAVRTLDEASAGQQHDIIDSLRHRVLADDERLRDQTVVEKILVPVDDGRQERPVVGRDDEIALIVRAVEQGAVIVRGEGGAGKTVVIQAAEPQLSGVVVRTACPAVPSSPYSPVHEVLAQLVDQPSVVAALADVLEYCDRDGLRWAAPPLAPWLGDGATPRPELRREQADHALVDFFERLGSALPVTVVVDDFHRAPRTSQQLLSAIAEQRRVRLVVGTRPDADLVIPGGVMIDLRPLGVDAVADLVAMELGVDADSVGRVAEEFVRLTGGNAFFVESMIRHSAATGALQLRDNGWNLAERSGLPVTVESAVMERLDTLSHTGVELVEFLAISSEPMPPAILASIDPRLPAALAEAVEAGVIRDAGRGVEVEHDLVAEAVQSRMPRVRRIDLHDELADAFEQSDEPNRVIHIARHRFEARELDPSAAVEALRAAGVLERSRSSSEFAVEHFVRARQVLDAPGSVADLDLAIQEGLARRETVDSNYVELLRDAAHQAVEIDEFDLAAVALIGLGDVGQVTTTGGGDAELIDLVDRTLADVSDPVLQVRLRVNTLPWYAMGASWQRPQQIWTDAFASAEQLGDETLRWEVLRQVDWGVDGPDQLEQRRSLGEELISHGRATGEHLSEYRGHFAAWGATVALGDRADLDRHHQATLELESVVHRGRSARLLAHRSAGMALLAGRFDEADTWMEKAVTLPNPFSPGWDFASMATVMVPVRLEQGRAGELVPFGVSSIAENPHSGVWKALLARCAIDGGDLELADQTLDALYREDFQQIARDQTFLVSLAFSSHVASTLGRRDASARIAELLMPYRSIGIWCGQGSVDPIGVPLARHAILEGRIDDATEHLSDAMIVARRLEAPVFIARASILAARLARLGAEPRADWAENDPLDVIIDQAEQNGWVAIRAEALAEAELSG